MVQRSESELTTICNPYVLEKSRSLRTFAGIFFRKIVKEQVLWYRIRNNP